MPSLTEWIRKARNTSGVKVSKGQVLHTQTLGHVYGSIAINDGAQVQIGDQYTHAGQATTKLSLDEDRHFSLYQSLRFHRIEARVHNVGKALQNTCDWLFQHATFQAWESGYDLQNHNGFLWIKGKPGCGKSTLMKTALERAQKQNTNLNSGQNVLSYFFSARAPSSLEKSSLGLYQTLTYQLLRAYPTLHSTFRKKFDYKYDSQKGISLWTKEELQNFLCDIIETYQSLSLCVFIDALDEGENQDEVRQMISFLVELSERALASSPSCRLRICLSSRHYPHISIKKGLSLVVEKQPEHDQAMKTYIQQKLLGPETKEKDELRAELSQRSKGIFLWVVLVVHMLNKLEDQGASLEVMMERLGTIPNDLTELFRGILSIEGDDIETTIAMYQCLLFSKEALEPQMLYLAVAYRCLPAVSSWRPDTIKVPSAERLTKLILNTTCGLVEVAAAKYQSEDINPVVQFIHETVREFLLSKDGLAALRPELATNLEGLSHESLKISCNRYICANHVPSFLQQREILLHSGQELDAIKAKIQDELPFIHYATRYLFSHAEDAQLYAIPQIDFLKTKIDSKGRWQGPERLWRLALPEYHDYKLASNETLRRFLAMHGCPSLSLALEGSSQPPGDSLKIQS